MRAAACRNVGGVVRAPQDDKIESVTHRMHSRELCRIESINVTIGWPDIFNNAGGYLGYPADRFHPQRTA
jgi:hypothetical protein